MECVSVYDQDLDHKEARVERQSREYFKGYHSSAWEEKEEHNTLGRITLSNIPIQTEKLPEEVLFSYSFNLSGMQWTYTKLQNMFRLTSEYSAAVLAVNQISS